MINGLDLFSGIGGLSVALAPWVRPVTYCENDPYAQAVLLTRQHNGHLPVAPIWDDVRTLRGELLPDTVDIVYGGFPCQDISAAGRGEGLEKGSRSGLFFEILRLVEEFRPNYVFLENVPAIRTRGLARVLSEFTAIRYDCRWTIVSAQDVGAPHLRKRWFLLAHSNDKGSFLHKDFKRVSDTHSKTLWVESRRGRRKSGKLSDVDSSNGEPWIADWTSKGGFKPRISGAGNGIPFAVDRDRALGNAVVPLQAREAFKRLMGTGGVGSVR